MRARGAGPTDRQGHTAAMASWLATAAHEDRWEYQHPPVHPTRECMEEWYDLGSEGTGPISIEYAGPVPPPPNGRPGAG